MLVGRLVVVARGLYLARHLFTLLSCICVCYSLGFVEIFSCTCLWFSFGFEIFSCICLWFSFGFVEIFSYIFLWFSFGFVEIFCICLWFSFGFVEIFSCTCLWLRLPPPIATCEFPDQHRCLFSQLQNNSCIFHNSYF